MGCVLFHQSRHSCITPDQNKLCWGFKFLVSIQTSGHQSGTSVPNAEPFTFKEQYSMQEATVPPANCPKPYYTQKNLFQWARKPHLSSFCPPNHRTACGKSL
ncbi:hypothetical protein KIL84_002695 [Mauremys mutica]|uniref:Uncharacterized protein n=1 Tax=Mauremys mutica TaxID=74926 RepID=A0A9D3WSD6_9SAUR|nr:hypothetical protein KIL84_002695 [Mauremys mutica]